MVVNILEEPSAVYGYANEPESNNGIVAGATARLAVRAATVTIGITKAPYIEGSGKEDIALVWEETVKCQCA